MSPPESKKLHRVFLLNLPAVDDRNYWKEGLILQLIQPGFPSAEHLSRVAGLSLLSLMNVNNLLPHLLQRVSSSDITISWRIWDLSGLRERLVLFCAYWHWDSLCFTNQKGLSPATDRQDLAKQQHCFHSQSWLLSVFHSLLDFGKSHSFLRLPFCTALYHEMHFALLLDCVPYFVSASFAQVNCILNLHWRIRNQMRLCHAHPLAFRYTIDCPP